MKTILVYGDSMTWGYNPSDGSRYAFERRWPNVMQAALGGDYRVIEEALNGRTTVWDDKFRDGRNGKAMLPAILESHAPLDLVVLMLGCNDLQPYRGVSAAEAARGCAILIEIIQKSLAGPPGKSPQVLLVAEPTFRKHSGLMEIVFKQNQAESEKLPGYLQTVAQALKCQFFDAAKVIVTSAVDGIHLDESDHAKLGQALAPAVRDILPA
jgi:lysophospholipase L1-like esterase